MSGEANLKMNSFSQADPSPTVQQRSVIFFIKHQPRCGGKLGRARRRRVMAGAPPAREPKNQMVGTYLSISLSLLGHAPTDCADMFVPALEKVANEKIESSLVAKNKAASISEELGEFTLFPKFPLELRLKIWVMTFKKEHVDLDIQKFWPVNRVGTATWQHIIPRPRFPMALHINRESRAETMRHYCITSTSSLRLTRHPNTPPICVNFSVDSCSFEYELVTNERYAKSYTDWLSKLAFLSPGGLAPLKELEIRNIWWHQSYKGDIDQEKMSTSWHTSRRMHYILALRLILRFTGLKRICFTWSQYFILDPSLATLLRAAPECRETIQAFMDRHKDNFIGNRAPEVKVRFWSKQDKAFMCSTRKGDNLLETEEQV